MGLISVNDSFFVFHKLALPSSFFLPPLPYQRSGNPVGLQQWFPTWDLNPVGLVCLFSTDCENF